ncbi:hypothetical protein QBC47DRAFT_366440 [Echria macrotheca]|uniref:Uncharacterized protein n=1 Tax=Echria macrotheca TaxID=438768 RepID=A0AAJ0BKZ1_9PEZI|nr:hypothetical protein QBC47DRAFT_366440 [Echria macrotheca]
MSWRVPVDCGSYQPVADFLTRAFDPAQTASVAQELASSSGPITAGAGSPYAALWDRLSTAAGGPAADVAKDRVPMPQDVPILAPKTPDNPLSDDDHIKRALEMFGHLRDITGIADLFIAMSNAAKREKRGHPDEYRITVPAEAAQAFADMADSTYNVMLGMPLAGMFSFGSGMQHTFSRRFSKTELHLGFISELFADFSLTDVAKKQLDGILKNFIKSLGDVTIQSEKTGSTVDQTIRVHQAMATNISGSLEHPIYEYLPRTRIIYMHIDASTWKWATNKANHEESTFNMQYVVVDIDLNVNRWLAAKPQLEAIFQEVTSQTFKQYGKVKFPVPIDAGAK